MKRLIDPESEPLSESQNRSRKFSRHTKRKQTSLDPSKCSSPQLSLKNSLRQERNRKTNELASLPEITGQRRGLAFESFKDTRLSKDNKRNSNTLNFNNLNILVDTGRGNYGKNGGEGKGKGGGKRRVKGQAKPNLRAKEGNLMMESWAADGRQHRTLGLEQIAIILKNLQCRTWFLLNFGTGIRCKNWAQVNTYLYINERFFE